MLNKFNIKRKRRVLDESPCIIQYAIYNCVYNNRCNFTWKWLWKHHLFVWSVKLTRTETKIESFNQTEQHIIRNRILSKNRNITSGEYITLIILLGLVFFYYWETVPTCVHTALLSSHIDLVIKYHRLQSMTRV